MNKNQFLNELSASLKKLPIDEKQDILQDFEEFFAIGLQEGKSEEQITASLGNPEQIARELVATYRIEKVEEKTTASNILKAVWAVIGLGFFNLLIVLAPFLTLVTLLIAGWMVSISLVLSPLLVLINVTMYPEIFEFFDLFFSTALTGVGLFIGIGMYFASRFMISGLVRYLKYNIRLVKGGMNHV